MASGNLPTDNSGHPIPVLRPENNQQVSYSTSTAASAVGTGVRCVRLVATTDCHVFFGGTAGGTATTSHTLLVANIPETFSVVPGEVLSVVQVSSAGVLHIAELA